MKKILSALAGLSVGATAAAAQAPIDATEPAFWAVSVADLEMSTEWYTTRFGLSLEREVSSRDGNTTARILTDGLLTVELISRTGSVFPVEELNLGHYFAARGIVKLGLFVADASAAHTALRTQGEDVDEGVFRDQIMNAMTFVLRDPDGNRIQIFERCGSGC